MPSLFRRASPRNMYGTVERRSDLPFWIGVLLLTSALILFFVFFGYYQVPQQAGMEPTILPGEGILVQEYFPGGTPKWTRGDIVAFRNPAQVQARGFARVIGVAGDQIRIENQQLMVNDVPLREPYKRHAGNEANDYLDNFPGNPAQRRMATLAEMLNLHTKEGAVVVPEDHLFVLGDDRDLAYDSRHWGLVPLENVTGRPVLVLWSYGAPREEPRIEAGPASEIEAPLEEVSRQSALAPDPPPNAGPSTSAKPGAGEIEPIPAAPAEKAPTALESRPSAVRWSRLFTRIEPFRYTKLPR